MLILLIIFIIFLFGFIFWVSSHLFSSIFYVSYVNSSKSAIFDALKFAKLKKGQKLVDLGCGRGDALIIAVKNFGAKATGYEISPLPYLLAKIRIFGNRSISVHCRVLQKSANDLKNANVIYLYLLNSALDKVEDFIFENIGENTKIVSLAFKFKKHQPKKEAITTNLGRKTKIYLYQK
ncbi:hypothetical protein COT51_02750 [candidate division WWE3 bacterium CG08_land_8_20_14_0_20_41_15]|uniref:Methyltransferase domain-containing protein n=1 Tax=candidate division WWE3 bacterium CG08_land_8_20_14_0_20_41_15 TaxID=1975086 RepID=A0A2H0X934_UNCKA|nr:MAG: hypothetical protein COT51_02750 [candidate division WWE3 bacterium CG08_land_8_20_14_0_20_41_15]